MDTTNLDLQNIYKLVTEYLVTYSFQLIAALLILLVGIWVANKISKAVNNLLVKQNIDVTLSTYVAKLTKFIIVIMVAVIALGKLGISVSPFIAAIGALGLGAGLALQGMLTNYAAGISIIVTRPFIVGDTIKVAGVEGQVKDIQLGYTILTNEEDEVISIPNKHIIGEIIHNSSEVMLVETTIGVAFHSDLEQVIAIMEATLQQQLQLQQQGKTIVGVANFADSAIEITARFWVPTATYFQDKYRINLALFNGLKQANIDIPFPQREVRLLQDS